MIQIEESGITRSRRSPISLKSLQQALHIEEVHKHYTVHNMYKIIIYPITRGFALFQCLNKFIFGNRGIKAMQCAYIYITNLCFNSDKYYIKESSNMVDLINFWNKHQYTTSPLIFFLNLIGYFHFLSNSFCNYNHYLMFTLTSL